MGALSYNVERIEEKVVTLTMLATLAKDQLHISCHKISASVRLEHICPFFLIRINNTFSLLDELVSGTLEIFS